MRLLTVAALVVLLAGCGGIGGRKSPPQSVGAYRIAVANRPARPIVGDNTLLIEVRDQAGKPVTNAAVEAVITMPAMGAMPRMESKGMVKEVGAGRYEARYGLGMGGDWTAELSVSAGGAAPARARYRVSTTTGDVQFEGGTGSPDGAADSSRAPAVATGDGEVIVLDPARRQEIGVRTEAIGMRRLSTTIRATGKVAYDETRRAEISLKFSGWVREIHADYTGQLVRAGEPLLSVYSPELLAAQQELLEALRPTASGPATGGHAMGGAPDSSMAAAARQRLLLWDIPPGRIDAIVRSGVAQEVVPIPAPVSGVVVEKNLVRGSAFTAGQTLYKIAPVNPIWVVASVYQYELSLVREGMIGTIETPFLGATTRRGRVSYINPYLDPDTRTGEVRLEVANPTGDLKPGMFVNVLLERDLGERLAVPESAVLFEGDRRVVFVDLGEGRLAPREVSLGAKAGNLYEVQHGLKAGDVVVTSGNFLISAESRLRSSGAR